MKKALERERISILIDKALLERVDEIANQTNMSRSVFMEGLVRTGLLQTEMTRKWMTNKYILKAFHLIFGAALTKYPQGEQEFDVDEDGPLKNAAAESTRRLIIEEMKRLSLAEAQADIDRQLGLEPKVGATPEKS